MDEPDDRTTRVAIDRIVRRDPLLELADILGSLESEASYDPSESIPLGLYFMLNRGDPPDVTSEIIALNRISLDDQRSRDDLADKTHLLWLKYFHAHDRAQAPLRQLLERIQTLLARGGNPNAMNYVLTQRELYREWLRSNRSKNKLRE